MFKINEKMYSIFKILKNSTTKLFIRTIIGELLVVIEKL